MSEPKLISPLLDGFQLGQPISDHDGVCCSPAVKGEEESRYIVKRISIPSSQVQLDALLLTGAYREPAAALAYFKEMSEAVEQEARTLKELAELDGFVCYEDWQIIPMDGDRMGFEVYLLSSYKRSLEQHMKRHTITHLEAINLGLDMCAALASARKNGWIYADLKPSNIFITSNNEFRIGDLGFLALDNLKYASLPEKYRSDYTAPELEDELCCPNTTIDTYALGKILYQIYNNGHLEQVDYPMETPLPSPENADYEMAEIIMKAISPDPADRWSDPVHMEQALTAYMQRNSVNNTPITPPRAEIAEPQPEPVEPVSDETVPGPQDIAEIEPGDVTDETARMLSVVDKVIQRAKPEDPQTLTIVPEQSEPDPEPEIPDPEEAPQTEIPEPAAEEPAAPSSQPESVSEEPKEIPEDKKSKKKQKKAAKERKVKEETDLGIQRRRARRKAFAITCLCLLLAGLLAAGGYLFYQNYYLLTVNDLRVDGAEDMLTVTLDADFDTALLTVHCTGTDGNTASSALDSGKASFDNLDPDEKYQIHLEVEGFHLLQGPTSCEYTTPAITRILDITAATGPSDGSVIVSFAVEGPDSESWTVLCTGTDGHVLEKSFSGNSVLVEGLTVGNSYTLQLVPGTDLYIPGEDSVTFTASQVILAENLEVRTDGNGNLSVQWNAPQGAQVENWHVRCYDNAEYDMQLTTVETAASFEGIINGNAYTVEVTAEGMTQPVRTSVTANPIHITDIRIDDSDNLKLKLSWDFQGEAPQGGWLLLYTIGKGSQQVVQCQDNSGTIEIRVPNAEYQITLQAADGTTVFDGTTAFTTPDTVKYENAPQAFYPKHQAQYFFTNLLPTPEKANWTHKDITRHDYTTTFTSGQKISAMLYYMQNFYIRRENIRVMYVIRDAEGNVLSDLIGIENRDWRTELWCGYDYHYCGLDIPHIPTEAGEYSVGIYFNGQIVTSLNFTITE